MIGVLFFRMPEILSYASCSLRSFYFLAITFCNNTAELEDNIPCSCCLIKNNTEIPATTYGRIISGTHNFVHMCRDDYHRNAFIIWVFIHLLHLCITNKLNYIGSWQKMVHHFFLLNNFTRSGNQGHTTIAQPTQCVTAIHDMVAAILWYLHARTATILDYRLDIYGYISIR